MIQLESKKAETILREIGEPLKGRRGSYGMTKRPSGYVAAAGFFIHDEEKNARAHRELLDQSRSRAEATISAVTLLRKEIERHGDRLDLNTCFFAIVEAIKQLSELFKTEWESSFGGLFVPASGNLGDSAIVEQLYELKETLDAWRTKNRPADSECCEPLPPDCVSVLKTAESAFRDYLDRLPAVPARTLPDGEQPEPAKLDSATAIESRVREDQREWPKPGDGAVCDPQEGHDSEADTPLLPAAGDVDEPKPIKCPPEKAIQAYRLQVLQGRPQAEIAQQLGTNQGQVSRWLSSAKKYLEAGNVLPELLLASKPQTVDPGVIDMGARRDGRTPRQVPKPSDD